MSASERQELLSRWTRPSSPDEKAQQDRAERLVRDAVTAHVPFRDSSISTYTKGSYPNNTNVRRDSDVDVVVEMRDLYYWDYHPDVVADRSVSGGGYQGRWTAEGWRDEVVRAMTNAFGRDGIDTTGRIAINIKAVAGSRPSADVVPSFLYRRFNEPEQSLARADQGSCVFPRGSASKIINWPQQQLDRGREKNTASGGRYKDFVRALKNAENTLVKADLLDDLPSYFMECLVFNVPDTVLSKGSLEAGFGETLAHMWNRLEDGTAHAQWVEPNRLKYLFRGEQKWTVTDGKALVLATWGYLGYKS